MTRGEIFLSRRWIWFGGVAVVVAGTFLTSTLTRSNNRFIGQATPPDVILELDAKCWPADPSACGFPSPENCDSAAYAGSVTFTTTSTCTVTITGGVDNQLDVTLDGNLATVWSGGNCQLSYPDISYSVDAGTHTLALNATNWGGPWWVKAKVTLSCGVASSISSASSTFSSSGPIPSSSGPTPSSSGPTPSSSGPTPSSSGPTPSSASGVTGGDTGGDTGDTGGTGGSSAPPTSSAAPSSARPSSRRSSASRDPCAPTSAGGGSSTSGSDDPPYPITECIYHNITPYCFEPYTCEMGRGVLHSYMFGSTLPTCPPGSHAVGNRVGAGWDYYCYADTGTVCKTSGRIGSCQPAAPGGNMTWCVEGSSSAAASITPCSAPSSARLASASKASSARSCYPWLGANCTTGADCCSNVCNNPTGGTNLGSCGVASSANTVASSAGNNSSSGNNPSSSGTNSSKSASSKQTCPAGTACLSEQACFDTGGSCDWSNGVAAMAAHCAAQLDGVEGCCCKAPNNPSSGSKSSKPSGSAASENWVFTQCPTVNTTGPVQCVFAQSCPSPTLDTGGICKNTLYQNGVIIAQNVGVCCESPVGGQCDGTECANGGDAFCAAQGKTCSTTAAFPCIQCTGGNTCTSDRDCPTPSCDFRTGCCGEGKCQNGQCTIVMQCPSSRSSAASSVPCGPPAVAGNILPRGNSFFASILDLLRFKRAPVAQVASGTQRIRVILTRVDSTDPAEQILPLIYIDGPTSAEPNRPVVSIASGEWVEITRLKGVADFYNRFRGLSLTQNRLLLSPYNWPRDGGHISYYGTVELEGKAITNLHCNAGNGSETSWYCPENWRDGKISEPDDDDVWIKNGVVHFAMHAKNVSNPEGNVDSFFFRSLSVSSAPSSRSSQRSASSVLTSSVSSILSSTASLYSSVASVKSSVLSSITSVRSSARSSVASKYSSASSVALQPCSQPSSGSNRSNSNSLGSNRSGTSANSNGSQTSNTSNTSLGSNGSNGSNVSSNSNGSNASNASATSNRSNASNTSANSSTSVSFCIQYPWLCEVNSSTSAGSTASTSSITGSTCLGNECTQGGSLFCSINGQTCVPISNLPCLACVGGSSSSAGSTTSQIACIGTCGNQLRECTEECDDGNLSNDDGCSNVCYLEGGYCGDRVIQSRLGEECEPDLEDIGVCNASCQFINKDSSRGNNHYCGDGRRTGMEECDDGNSNERDSCDNFCFLTSGSCGDGVVQVNNNEECEPSGNIGIACGSNCRYLFDQPPPDLVPMPPRESSSYSAFSESLTYASAAGRQFYAPGETPAIFPSSLPACTKDSDCPGSALCILNRCLTPEMVAVLPVFCGNVRIDPGEGCDNGVLNSNAENAQCRSDCMPQRCGDAIVDTPLEQCDDGNTTRNDGCSPTCAMERTAADDTHTLPATVVELPFAEGGDPSTVIRLPNGEVMDQNGNRITDNGQLIADNGQPVITKSPAPSTPDTGPAALAVMIAGGAAGWLYRRRR